MLVGVLAVAAVVRYYDLQFRGLIYWDEGKFALEGIRFLVLVRDLLGAHDPVSLGKAVGTAKPGHALFIALAYAVLGVHDFAPLYLDACASLVSVALTFLIGRRLFGTGTGLAAALLLATSEYDVIYARSALSESDAVVLFMTGAWIWLRWGVSSGASAERGGVLAAAAVAGCAFTVNYRMLVYIAALVLLDLLWSVNQHGLGRQTPLRCAAWAPLVVAPLAWQAADLVARAHGLALFRNEILHAPTTYLAQAAYQIHEGKQSVVRFEPLAYPLWYIVRQGWWGFALLCLALGIAAIRRTFSWLVPSGFVVVPYCIYLTAPFVVPRNMVAALPFACILVAALLASATRRVTTSKYWPALGSFVTLLVCLANLSLAWRETGVRSGLTAAARYVITRDGGKALVTNEVLEFYLRDGAGPCLAPRVPYDHTQLAADIHYGYRYAVLDQNSGSPMQALIKLRLRPVASFSSLGTASLGENIIDSENTNIPGKRPLVRYVPVYDLARLRLFPPRNPQRPQCSREEPP